MTIGQRENAGIAILDIQEEMKLWNSAPVWTAVEQLVKNGQVTLLINLSACDDVDATVIAILQRSRKHALEHGGNLALCDPRRMVKRLIEAFELRSCQLPWFRTEKKALTWLRNPTEVEDADCRS